jgi:hypothetical protein
MARLASESLDRDLGPLERFALRSHVLYCVACRRYLRQVRLMKCALRRHATDPSWSGAVLPDDVRARIKQLLKRN